MKNAIAHIVIWLTLLLFPVIMQNESDQLDWRYMTHIYLMLFELAIIFYFNYQFAIDRYLYTRGNNVKKHVTLFVVLNLCLIVVLLFSYSYLYDFIRHITTPDISDAVRHKHKAPSIAMRTMFWYNNLVFYALSIGAALGLRYAQRVNKLQTEKLQLENLKTQTEVTLIKYQLQPHFLFNTLNNIYSLIAIDQPAAEQSVMNLSKLLRYILYDNTSVVIDLNKEIEFIQNYLALKKLSLNNNVAVNAEFPTDTDGYALPPLLLIPLIENAFKHGIKPKGESSINISLQINPEENTATLNVTNPIVPQVSEDNHAHTLHGIGLQNLQKLLLLSFEPGSYTLKTNIEDDIFIAHLQIPLTRI